MVRARRSSAIHSTSSKQMMPANESLERTGALVALVYDLHGLTEEEIAIVEGRDD